MDMPQLVTTRDLKRLLRIGAVTLKKLVMSGELRRYRIGYSVRYRLSDIEAFLESCVDPISRAAELSSLDDETIEDRDELQDDRLRVRPPPPSPPPAA